MLWVNFFGKVEQRNITEALDKYFKRYEEK